MFVRLAYSLVTVKRPGQPLTTRDEVAEYARDCFGPYLQGLESPTAVSVVPAPEAVVVDLEQRRASRTRLPRPYLQIAAASIVTIVTLGAGLTAVLGGDIKLPFIIPAGISRSTTTAIPASVPPGPTQGGPGGTSGPQLPGEPAAPPPSAPGSPAPSLTSISTSRASAPCRAAE